MKTKKRDIFNELFSGVNAMKKHRKGKITLRTHAIESIELPEIDGALIRKTREKLNMSQAIFAGMLQVNPRTLANWEQGRSKPNDQAVVLILLVREYPDTLKRLMKIAA
jgi:putative transcriptional regulator